MNRTGVPGRTDAQDLRDARKAATGLQRGHGRGSSPSKPSIRVRSPHSPHHGGRDRGPGGLGSSVGESRVVSTAYGFRRPPVFEPVKAASSRGGHPASSAASTAGRILSRCAAVSGQASPRPSKNSPAGPPPNRRSPPGRAVRAHTGRRTVHWVVSSTVRVQPLHPVPALIAPRPRAGCTPFPARGATAAPRWAGYPQPRCRWPRGAVVAPRQTGRQCRAAQPERACCPALETDAQGRRRRRRPGRRGPGRVFKSQPCGRRSARLIRAATISGSHGEMMPSAPSRSGQVRTVRSDSPV